MKNSGSFVGIGIFLLAGILLLFTGVHDYNGLKKAKEASTLDASEIKKGLMVKGKADIVLDYYCYETKDGNETYRWYLIPATNDMQLKYIGVKVNAGLFNSYEEVYKSTADFMEGKTDRLTKTISYQGKVTEVKGDVKKNLDVWAKKSGLTENQDDILLPYYIELKTTKGSFTSIIAGAVCLFLSGLIFILAKFRNKKDKQVEEDAFANIKVNPGWMNGYVIDNDELNKATGVSNDVQNDAAGAYAAAQDAIEDGYGVAQSTVEDAFNTVQNTVSDTISSAEEAVKEAAEEKDEIVADKIDVL